MNTLFRLSTFLSQLQSSDQSLGTRHFEIIGTPGSGKSTLLQQFKNISGVNVNDKNQDIYFLAFDSLTNGTFTVKRLKRLSERLYRKLSRNLKNSCLDRFIQEFPEVAEIIDKAGSIDDRNRYPGVYFSAAAEYICLRDFSSGPFVLDEGLTQLSGEVSGQDSYLGEKFLKTIPVPDGVIYVRCSAEECFKRQKEREKAIASSLAGLNRLDAIGRLEQYNESFESVVRILKNRGVKVVEIDAEKYSIEDCYKQALDEFETFILE